MARKENLTQQSKSKNKSRTNGRTKATCTSQKLLRRQDAFAGLKPAVMWVQAASRDHDREAEDGFASEVVAWREKRI